MALECCKFLRYFCRMINIIKKSHFSFSDTGIPRRGGFMKDVSGRRRYRRRHWYGNEDLKPVKWGQLPSKNHKDKKHPEIVRMLTLFSRACNVVIFAPRVQGVLLFVALCFCYLFCILIFPWSCVYTLI